MVSVATGHEYMYMSGHEAKSGPPVCPDPIYMGKSIIVSVGLPYHLHVCYNNNNNNNIQYYSAYSGF